jgi:ADP-heptose:LPS heptosyltransferase
MTELPPIVLAIRLRQLGDVLSTLGSLRALKRASPGHRILFVADRVYHPLLRKVPFLDELVAEPPFAGGLRRFAAYAEYVEAIRRRRPSCVLDFHSNTRSSILSYLSGAPVRVGFDVRVRKLLYTDVEPRAVFSSSGVAPRTSHESALALVRRGGFPAADGTALGTIPVTAEDRVVGREILVRSGIDRGAVERGEVVGLNPGNPYPAKAWAAENFGRLARMLGDEGKAVVVFWGPGEEGAVRRVVAESRGAARTAPALTLEQLPGVLSATRLVVTIDSGLKHLCVASGVPTVTLFGPTSPMEWHMGGALDRYAYTAEPCSPCRLKECPYEVPCMTKISPAAVRNLVAEIERESSPR